MMNDEGEREFDHKQYLEKCAHSKLISSEELAVIGVFIVLALSVLDLCLTLFRIYTGPFQEANPIGRFIIDMGVPEGLVLLKALAGVFFAWVCLKYKELLITQLGVGFACLVHILLIFYWSIVF